MLANGLLLFRTCIILSFSNCSSALFIEWATLLACKLCLIKLDVVGPVLDTGAAAATVGLGGNCGGGGLDCTNVCCCAVELDDDADGTGGIGGIGGKFGVGCADAWRGGGKKEVWDAGTDLRGGSGGPLDSPPSSDLGGGTMGLGGRARKGLVLGSGFWEGCCGGWGCESVRVRRGGGGGCFRGEGGREDWIRAETRLVIVDR